MVDFLKRRKCWMAKQWALIEMTKSPMFLAFNHTD